MSTPPEGEFEPLFNPGEEKALLILSWTYDEKTGPNFDGVMRELAPHIPDGVHTFSAIRETAEAILEQFREDAH